MLNGWSSGSSSLYSPISPSLYGSTGSSSLYSPISPSLYGSTSPEKKLLVVTDREERQADMD